MSELQKFDAGKPRVSLVEPDFILGVAQVLTFGADKYGSHNWKKMTPEDIDRFKDATLRHILASQKGEHHDPESGIDHLLHAATNLMFLHWASQQNRLMVNYDYPS